MEDRGLGSGPAVVRAGWRDRAGTAAIASSVTGRRRRHWPSRHRRCARSPARTGATIRGPPRSASSCAAMSRGCASWPLPTASRASSRCDPYGRGWVSRRRRSAGPRAAAVRHGHRRVGRPGRGSRAGTTTASTTHERRGVLTRGPAIAHPAPDMHHVERTTATASQQQPCEGLLDLMRCAREGARTQVRGTPRSRCRGRFLIPRRSTWIPSSRPGLRPRLHDRGRGRPDQPARHPPDARRGTGRTGSLPGSAWPRPTPRTAAIAAFGLTAITDAARRRAARPRSRRRRLPAVARVADVRSARPRRATVTTSAPGLRRRLPLDPRADPDEPDDDPVVRCALRRARRDGSDATGRGAHRRSACSSARRAWWVVLTTAVGALRTRITTRWLHGSTRVGRRHRGVRDRRDRDRRPGLAGRRSRVRRRT